VPDWQNSYATSIYSSLAELCRIGRIVTQRVYTHLSLAGVKQPDCTNSYATSIYSYLADIIAMLGQILAEHNESQVHRILVNFEKDKPT
jgi:hypothetical protein